MNKKDCTFCKIVKGEIPSIKVWEDEKHIAFLDITPATKGHTLVIPKEHFENIFEIPETDFESIMGVVKKIASLVKEKLNADGMNILNSNNPVAQQEIPHFHIHLIPRYNGSNFKIELKNKTKINQEELNKIAGEIRK